MVFDSENSVKNMDYYQQQHQHQNHINSQNKQTQDQKISKLLYQNSPVAQIALVFHINVCVVMIHFKTLTLRSCCRLCH